LSPKCLETKTGLQDDVTAICLELLNPNADLSPSTELKILGERSC